VDVEVLIFECAGIQFGLPASRVSEVVRAVAVTPAPQTLASLLGVINLRGQLVAVLNTRLLLGLDPVPLHPSHQFLIVRSGDGLYALHVDRAIDMVTTESVQRESGFGDALPIEANEGLVRFAAKTDGVIVPVIAPDKILSDEISQAIRMVTSTTATESHQ
jgi:purine-binding chemotaxis protein CheW